MDKCDRGERTGRTGGRAGLRVLVLNGAGAVLEARTLAQSAERLSVKLAESACCVVFIAPEAELEGALELVGAFIRDKRMAVAGLKRVDGTGCVLNSVCLKPTWADLLCRLLIALPSRRGLLGPGLPIPGFEHNRKLTVEAVHPQAWAVRATHWVELQGVAGELSWEYGVQDFVDRVARHGLETFFLPTVCVTGVDRRRDCWCRPSRDLAALCGLFGYVRRRWGYWWACLFRWIFKPLFLMRLSLELPVRGLFAWRGSEGDRGRALDGPGAIARFLVFEVFGFLRAK